MLAQYDSDFTLDYEPYQGETFTIDFGQTIYGGTLDWAKGTIECNYRYIELTGDETWTLLGGTNSLYYRMSLGKENNLTTEQLCSHVPYKTSILSSNTWKGFYAYYSSDGPEVRLSIRLGAEAGTDLASWKSYLAEQKAAGTPVQICYKLATPYTIQLSPTQIQSLKGINTIYSSDGVSSVIFNSELLNYDITPISVEQIGNFITVENGIDGYGFKATSIIELQQSGSGDPYPAGGGKNLIPTDVEKTTTINGITFTYNKDGSVTANGTATAVAVFQFSYNFELQAGSYLFSGCPTDGGASTYSLRLTDGANINNDNTTSSPTSVELTEESKKIKHVAAIVRAGYTANNLTFYPMLRKATETNNTYQPYSNIRPINGMDTVSVARCRKNLLDDTLKVEYQHEIYIGSEKSGYITLPAGIYTYSVKAADGLNTNMYVYNYETKQTLKKYSTNHITFILDKPSRVRFHVFKDTYTSVNDIVSAQVERESTVTAYEEYNGNTFTISLGETVYGGELDWNTGVLTVTKECYSITGNESFMVGNVSASSTVQQINVSTSLNNIKLNNSICNEYSHQQSVVSGSVIGYRIYTKDCFVFGIPMAILQQFGGDKNDSSSLLSAAKTYFSNKYNAGTPVQIVYELEEPYTIQLTPKHLTMLQGKNNFYSNSTTLKIKTNTSIITSEVVGKLKVLSYANTDEGGEIQLKAPESKKNVNGIVLDNKNGALRIFGEPSVDGTTKTGSGNIFSVDPYAKTITADSYTFSGTAQKSATSFVSVGEPSSEQYFYPIFVTNKNQNYYAPKVSSGLQFYTKVGTTSVVGSAQIGVGNNIKSGTAGNMAGALYIYGTNSAYTYLKTANNTTTNNTLYLPSGETDGVILTDKSYTRMPKFVHHAAGTGGTIGYIKFATINISGTYQDAPLVFELSRRGSGLTSTLYLTFKNVDSTDPDLFHFYYVGADFNCYVHKRSAGIWDLYYQKSGGYDNLGVLRYHKSLFMQHVNVTWADTQVDTYPSGATKATLSGVVSQAYGDSAGNNIINTYVPKSNVTSANNANSVVGRDSNGNFNAGIITATLNGSSASANKLNTAAVPTAPTGGLYLFHSSATAHNNSADYSADAPENEQYGSVLRVKYNNGSVYYTDMFIDTNKNRLSYKTVSNGVSRGWVHLLDTGNYTTYTVKQDGTGATGNWGINAATASKLATAKTLTIGNSGKSFDGSDNVSWNLHDILYASTLNTSSSWNILTPGVYYVASSSEFTGTGNPESANGGLAPYRYGQLIVSRAAKGGLAQFYISHNDSGNSSYGIKFRSGWNETYVDTWKTLLDSTNYTNYTVSKTGTGASGSWNINAATATTASQIEGLQGLPSSYTYYYPMMAVGSGNSDGSTSRFIPRVSPGFAIYTKNGTTSENGIVQLGLGNTTASGTAGNLTGAIYLYGAGKGYTMFKPSNNSNNNYTVLLPAASGTLMLAGENGALPITQGGTGKTTAAEARVALGITSSTTQTVYHTGNIVASSTAPTNPTEGMIWLKI